MLVQQSRYRRAFYILALIVVTGIYKLCISRTTISLTRNFSTSTWLISSVADDTNLNALHCRDIELQEDQCAFVKSACHGFNALYLELYYCSELWKPLSISILLTTLLMLFGAIGVVASDFFCPNLQTISAKLQLSESMAGVTILALGNGSPDLFSTFSALDTGAGSLAIGELIGAAFFIVAVVSGSMGIIKPFQSERITFMRDTSFLTGAIMLISWIIYHQRIYWYHSVALIGYYLSYVAAVVLSSSSNTQNTRDDKLKCDNHNLKVDDSAAESKKDNITIVVDETTHLLNDTGRKPPRLTIPNRGYSPSIQSNLSDLSTNHLGHVLRPTSPLSSRSIYYDSLMQKSMSSLKTVSTVRTHRRPMTPRIGIRSSVFGAIEFQQQVNSMMRENSNPHITSPNGSQYPSVNSPISRQRQTSMPPPMQQQTLLSAGSAFQPRLQQQQNLLHHGSQAVLYQQTRSVGRQRSSTTATADLCQPPASLSPNSTTILSLTPQTHHFNLPHSPSSAADDYFTYLSLHNSQPHFIQVQQEQQQSTPQQAPVIPTINISEIATSLDSNKNNRQENLHDLQHHQLQQQTMGNTSLLTFDHRHTTRGHPQGNRTSSALTSPQPSEYDLFVSARQSPNISPSPSLMNMNQPLQQQGEAVDNLYFSLKVPMQQQSQVPMTPAASNNSTVDDPTFTSPKRPLSVKDHNSYLAPMHTNKILLVMQDVLQLLFPALDGWSEKTLFSKLNALASTPFILIFTLTLPVAESENIQIDDVEVIPSDTIEDTAMAVVVGRRPEHMQDGRHHSRASSFNNMGYSNNNRSYLSVNDNYHEVAKQTTTATVVTQGVPAARISIEEDNGDIQQGWNRQLLTIQCVFSLLFISSVFYMNGMVPSYVVALAGLLGLILACIVWKISKKEEPPSWFWMVSFFGFFVSLNWIFLLANEVVGLLQALGEIFSISESIMGLTVFALGNSIGDLVTNTAIAKMGFPTMAISACYAGPLLNMVLGVGVSSFYQTWKLGDAYKLDIAPTILISAGGLMTVLISTLVAVNINGYHVTRQLGWWMIFVYFACCITNFLIEFEVIH